MSISGRGWPTPIAPTTPHEQVVRNHWEEHGLPCESVPWAWYFPERNDPDKHEKVTATRRLCSGCPVRTACLQWALDEGINHGMWGAVSADERRRLRRARKTA